MKIKNLRIFAAATAIAMGVTLTSCGTSTNETTKSLGTVIEETKDNTCVDELLKANKKNYSDLLMLEECVKVLKATNKFELDDNLLDESLYQITSYKVVSGDTLESVAKLYNTDKNTLMVLNCNAIFDYDNLSEGQEINVINGFKMLSSDEINTAISNIDKKEGTSEERINLANKIQVTKQIASSLVSTIGENILRKAEISLIKGKILDAYDLDEDDIDKVTIEPQIKENPNEISIDSYDVDKNGNAISDEIQPNCGSLKNSVSTIYTLTSTSPSKETFTIDQYYNALENMKKVLEEEYYVKDGIFGRSLKVVRK